MSRPSNSKRAAGFGFFSVLLCSVFLCSGCVGEVNISNNDPAGCTNITPKETATLKREIQQIVDTSTELAAFHAYVTDHADALEQALKQGAEAHYQWTKDHWEFVAATTGETRFTFNSKESWVIQWADGEANGHLEGPGFSYYIRAESPKGFPTGKIRLLSLGEWGAGSGTGVEYFGSVGLVYLKFPGGQWEEKQESDISGSYQKFILLYTLPHIDAKVIHRIQDGEDGETTLEITVNGSRRCAATENVLKAAFPDVNALLQMK